MSAAWVLEASYYLWRSKFGGLEVSDAKRLKALELENARLKRLLAEALLEQAVSRHPIILRCGHSILPTGERRDSHTSHAGEAPTGWPSQSISVA